MRALRTWLAGLISFAAALSVLNWSTACCCGTSRLLAYHVHGHAGHAHWHHAHPVCHADDHHHGTAPLRAPYRCYKQGCDWSGGSIDHALPPLASVDLAPPPDLPSFPSSEVWRDPARGERPRAGPPALALYLRHGHLLI